MNHWHRIALKIDHRRGLVAMLSASCHWTTGNDFLSTNFNISKNINYLEKQSPRTRFTLIELTKQESASHLLTRTVNDRTQVRKIYVVQNKSGTNIHAVRTSKHRKVHIHIVRRSQVVPRWICMKVWHSRCHGAKKLRQAHSQPGIVQPGRARRQPENYDKEITKICKDVKRPRPWVMTFIVLALDLSLLITRKAKHQFWSIWGWAPFVRRTISWHQLEVATIGKVQETTLTMFEDAIMGISTCRQMVGDFQPPSSARSHRVLLFSSWRSL